MHTRENALQKWLTHLTPDTHYHLTSLAGDASFRRYYRYKTADISRIVMDAPPDKLSLEPFIRIAEHLSQAGFRTPNIHAVEKQLGFMLLEDFGDQLFFNALKSHQADALYQHALKTLAHLH